MTQRFICPHCHQSIDPQSLEFADSAEAHYRVCPECDEPFVLSARHSDRQDEPAERPLAATLASRPAASTERLPL